MLHIVALALTHHFDRLSAAPGPSLSLPPGRKIAISLAIPPAHSLPGKLFPTKDNSVYEEVNQRLAARVYVSADEQGRFAGTIKFPASLPAGKYYLLALTNDGPTTWTGNQPIYYRTIPFDKIPLAVVGLIISTLPLGWTLLKDWKAKMLSVN